MPPKLVFSIMFGIVDETNGDQSCPKRTNALLLSLNRRSILTHANRIEGWLERIEVMFRLFTRVKSPSKSNSIFPVIAVFGAGSTHSKLAPSRRPRARRWNSGELFGPVSAASSGSGKSFPCGEDES